MSKSIATQIAALEAKLAKGTEQLAALKAKAAASSFSAEEGAVIAFNYGKKDKQVLEGVVLGMKRPEEGKPGGTFVVVESGTGIGKRVLTIPVADVVRVKAE